MKLHNIRSILVALLCFLSAPQLTYSKDTNLTKADRLNQEVVRLFQQGRYQEAIPIAKEVLAITKKTLGPEHPDMATYLNNLAMLYKSLGEYAKAEPLYQQSLAIIKQVYGSEHPYVVTYLNNLAVVYLSLGNYEKTRPLFQQSLAITKKAFGPEHPDVARSLNSLAGLYFNLGEYAKAETLYQRALAIAKKALDPEHPDMATYLKNLATVYKSLGEYAKAEPLYQQSLAIMKKALGPEHPSVAVSLNNLARLYSDLGEYAKAEPLYQQSLTIAKKTLGPEHPNVATYMSGMAMLYQSLGEYEKAEPLYQQSLAITRKTLGPEHPYVVTYLMNLANLYAALNKFQNAHEIRKRSLEIDDKLIDQVMGFTSEEQKMKFLSTKQRILFAFLSMVNQHLSKSPSARIDGLNVWLKRKGIILESQKRFQETLIYSDDPLVVQIFQELSRVRAQLSRLTFSGPGKKGMDAYKSEVTLLKKQKEELEARLAKLSQKFAVRQEASKADCTKVAIKLPANTVLIEFALISRFNFKARGKEQKWMPDRYLAIVLHAGNGEMVDWVDLGPANKIDNPITNFKKEIILLNEDHALMTNTFSKKLYTLIFEPLKKSLGGAMELFISPDGNLNLIPFEVLQTPEGRYLIEDYTFNYLASGRDIIGFGQIKERGTKTIIIGDPDFNMDSEQKASILKTIGLAQKKDGNTTPRSAGMRGFFFERLPGTKEEVEKIGTLFDKEKVNLYTGREAVEEVLKQKSTPKILHLATHGFFLSDLDLSTLTDERGLKIVPDYTRPIEKKIEIENPLLCSGIALAGANNSLKFSNMEKSDGIVTAEKILGLRLRGTDMVVLSACETGLGEVKAGEGVYGLRRAFTQAGSRSIVMSMWSVPDRETKELMVEFYRNIQSGKMNRCQALRQAALKEKKVVRKRYGHTNPLFWGAFVFMGEP